MLFVKSREEQCLGTEQSFSQTRIFTQQACSLVVNSGQQWKFANIPVMSCFEKSEYESIFLTTEKNSYFLSTNIVLPAQAVPEPQSAGG